MFKTTIRILAWVVLLAILAATISPIAERPQLGSGPTLERGGAFALLGLLFCMAYRRFWPLALVIVVLAAGGFEAAQMLTADRHASVVDAMVKLAGGAVGLGLGLLVKRPDLTR